MGMRRAQEIGIGLSRQAVIVGEPAAAGDEADIFLAAHRLADTELSQRSLLTERFWADRLWDYFAVDSAIRACVNNKDGIRGAGSGAVQFARLPHGRSFH